MKKTVLLSLLLFLATPVQAGEPTPLFASSEPIAISISAPWKEVKRSSPDDEPIAGVLTMGDETLPVLISTRGKSRREKHVCDFPPLRVEFAEKPPEGSLFRKQEKLKLTTFCRRSSSHQQVVLKEYAAYALYNAVTPQSFRARLASVSYIDAKSGKTDISRTGFFLEDIDDVAKRNDMKEVERGDTPLVHYDQGAAARVAVFEYMIGNLDWNMTTSTGDEACCHNVKIIAAEATAGAGLIPAPYDFDMSGFVDAPYAIPAAQFRLRSVRSRVYRGFCSHNDETRTAAADFLARREAFEQAIDATPGLTAGTLKKAKAYLAEFFEDVSSGAGVEKNLIAKCRG